MYDYTKVLNPNSLNPVEQKLEIYSRHSIDVTDILYKYQTLYERIEVLRALNATARLLENSTEFKNNKEKYKSLLVYLCILNNIDNQNDFFLFCENPRKKIVHYDPWFTMVEFIIYRDRIAQPAKQLYPEFKKYLEDTEILLNQAITEIESRITIIVPGRIQKAESINSTSTKKEILL